MHGDYGKYRARYEDGELIGLGQGLRYGVTDRLEASLSSSGMRFYVS